MSAVWTFDDIEVFIMKVLFNFKCHWNQWFTMRCAGLAVLANDIATQENVKNQGEIAHFFENMFYSRGMICRIEVICWYCNQVFRTIHKGDVIFVALVVHHCFRLLNEVGSWISLPYLQLGICNVLKNAQTDVPLMFPWMSVQHLPPIVCSSGHSVFLPN